MKQKKGNFNVCLNFVNPFKEVKKWVTTNVYKNVRISRVKETIKVNAFYKYTQNLSPLIVSTDCFCRNLVYHGTKQLYGSTWTKWLDVLDSRFLKKPSEDLFVFLCLVVFQQKTSTCTLFPPLRLVKKG